MSRLPQKTISRRSGQSVELHPVHIDSKSNFQTIRTECRATLCSNRVERRFAHDLDRVYSYTLPRSHQKTICRRSRQSVELHFVQIPSKSNFQTIRTECRATLCSNRVERRFANDLDKVYSHPLPRSPQKTISKRSGQSVELHPVQIVSKDDSQKIWTECITTLCPNRLKRRFPMMRLVPAPLSFGFVVNENLRFLHHVSLSTRAEGC